MAEAVVGKLITYRGLDFSPLQVLDNIGFGFTACITLVYLADDCRFFLVNRKGAVFVYLVPKSGIAAVG